MRYSHRAHRQGALALPSVEGIFQQYFRDLADITSEPARSARFATLLRELFNEEPQLLRDYLGGRERAVQIHESARVRAGRIDSLCGNLVIEFKASLAGCGRPGDGAQGSLADAQAQLCRYIAALWSEEAASGRRPYLAMATDGQLFAVYTPIAADPDAEILQAEDIHLQPLSPELVNLAELPPERARSWLDRYFLHTETRVPTTEEIVADFGLDSHAFRSTAAELMALWNRVRSDPAFAVLFESWDNYLRVAYGTSFADQPGGADLFIRHTYLATLAKLMVWARVAGGVQRDAPPHEFTSVLSGAHFENLGISNFLEEDFFAWIVRDHLAGAKGKYSRRYAVRPRGRLAPATASVLRR